MNSDYLTLELNLPTLAAIASAAWFLWLRYQNLERRFQTQDQKTRELELDLVKEAHALNVSRQAEISDREHTEYLVTANRELIEHRTRRFCDEIERLRRDVQQDILEIKQFLDKTTDFHIRDRSERGD